MSQPDRPNSLPPLSEALTGADDDALAGPTPPQPDGYELIEPIGRGGMGVVWKARQQATRREVALKILPEMWFHSAKARARFAREVELAARLEHPGIARVYDSGMARGGYYYAMQLVEGQSLPDYLCSHRPSRRELLLMTVRICQAVQHAHQRGIIHRDLKPANVLVDSAGMPVVVDFGLAKTLLAEEGTPAVSQDGEIAGTPAYMAPEQAAGQLDRIDTRSDVYALGAMLYELLTGEVPHDMTGPRLAVLRRLSEQDVRSPRSLRPDLDRELEAIVLKALAHDPEQRYRSAGALAEDLTRYLEGEPVSARPATLIYFARKRLRKYRLQVALAGAVAAALITMATVAYVRVMQERDVAIQAESAERAQRARADEAADRARAQALAARQRLYANQTALAQAELARDNARQAQSILAATDPAMRGWELKYLAGQADQSLRTWRLDPAPTALAGTADGGRVLVGQADGQVRWLELGSQQVPGRTLFAHTGRVCRIALSPDADSFATSGADGAVRIWDSETGQKLAELAGHVGPVCGLAWGPKGKLLASGGDDGTCRVWDATSGKLLAVLTPRRAASDRRPHVNAVGFAPDGSAVLTGSGDGAVRQWTRPADGWSAGGADGTVLTRHEGIVACVTLDTTGRWVASGGTDRRVRLWDRATGAEVDRTWAHRDVVSSVAFDEEGRLASAGWDHAVRRWAPAQAEPLGTWVGHTGPIGAVAWLGGDRWATASSDGTVRLWDGEGPTAHRSLAGHRGWVMSAAWDRTGMLLTGDMRGNLLTWRQRQGGSVSLHAKAQLGQPLLDIAVGTDWTLMATGSVLGPPGLETPLLDRIRKAHEGAISAVAVRGPMLASGDRAGAVRVWRLTGGDPVAVTHPGGVNGLAFDADAGRLASAGGDGKVRVWSAQSGKMLAELAGHAGRAYAVSFSPDGQWLVSGGEGGRLRLYDARGLTYTKMLAGHDAAIYDVAWLDGGGRLASASEDGTVRIWDPLAGTEVLALRPGRGAIWSLAVSPDGRSLAAGTQQATVEIWHAK